MKSLIVYSFLFISAFLRVDDAFATCQIQSVHVSSGGKEISNWDVRSADIHGITLANGFQLGLKIEPATADTYREMFQKTGEKMADELVKITLYDMRGSAPKQLTTTWGGSNSRQGYGPGGGADMVQEVGEPGIELWLHKAICIKTD